jgi:hypothetical protein
MRFIVKRRDGFETTRTNLPFVRLVQNNWDDYGYKTMFLAELHMSTSDVIESGLFHRRWPHRSEGERR